MYIKFRYKGMQLCENQMWDLKQYSGCVLHKQQSPRNERQTNERVVK